MANKQEFKKTISAIGGAVYENIMTAYFNVDGVDRDKLEQSAQLLAAAVEKARHHANITFERGCKSFESPAEYGKAKATFFKALFQKIDTEFAESINESIKLLNEAIPAEVREHNKAVANATKA